MMRPKTERAGRIGTMVVHWEQLDERERNAWLALVAAPRLADQRRTLAQLDEINRDLKRPGIVLRPWRLLSGAIIKIRLTMRLTRFLRRLRSYERALGAKYASAAGGTGRVVLIGFAGSEELRELEWRASREVRASVDEMIGAG